MISLKRWRRKTITRMLNLKWMIFAGCGIAFVACITLALLTYVSIRDVSSDILHVANHASRAKIVDRYGNTLTSTYQNKWNVHDTVVLHDVPPLLLHAFIYAEDQRFYSHTGVDWLARVNAVKQNLQRGKRVRGASTISEQVIKMIHKRPRTLWSRWLEGFEASKLESKLTKLQILEFYINQVPFAANRRGIVQGARFYFDRDLSALNEKEMLALAVMVRAPSVLTPNKNNEALEKRIAILHERLTESGITLSALSSATLESDKESDSIIGGTSDISHLARYLRKKTDAIDINQEKIYTTIDAGIQFKTQQLLDQRLHYLHKNNVNNGAALIVDHQRSEILAWVVGFAGKKSGMGNDFDAVTVKRQPGSTLKPFVYAGAMEKGWTAATMIDDSPLKQSVGQGMHQYHNYSRSHYGLISLREALGNSLNIPAVKAAQFIGGEDLLLLLQRLGINNLTGHPNVYGDGLALGNGEISLLELVQAYSTLARMGNYSELSALDALYPGDVKKNRRVLSVDVASIIGNILSDSYAREKEFGRYSILNFPYQTAVKTGTSSDYRDAWSVGYNDRYTVGVWMGNMDYQPMEKITGSTGPAIVLRSIFNELNRHREVKPLYLSRNLEKHRICNDTGEEASRAKYDCSYRDEWFVAGSYTKEGHVIAKDSFNVDSFNVDSYHVNFKPTEIRMRLPTPGLRMAMDPRIPDENEFFKFALQETEVSKTCKKVDWYINESLVATTDTPQYLWPLSRGKFNAYAKIELKSGEVLTTAPVSYSVQ